MAAVITRIRARRNPCLLAVALATCHERRDSVSFDDVEVRHFVLSLCTKVIVNDPYKTHQVEAYKTNQDCDVVAFAPFI